MVILDIGNSIADSAKFLRFLIGNIDTELFFKSHNKVNDIKGVRAEVFDESRGFNNRGCFYSQFVNNNFFNLINNISHIKNLLFVSSFSIYLP
ncbi:MAG: hypothetical protein A2Y33_00010 [Spirochaetes bacterium GWF1_51_8]|nr:MAG: hypothetical protein A2Y33_00010 [Spirochaetes bacterium GWF1_51_8]